ncbi:Outer membrane protein assembly factor BamB, contains PQQ-like beta-propeller repeat [Halorientalis persicus]|uniref:Outer membrane protein assembly factor BamB, contains PQQ-like beta-propeller repeat n=1 Tax=Halorientalis persicus TaxID=1367881 RepID=A0A1H8VUT6_9EURY|nr:PQQ-binding-like beta-propeller repeat protein [Halorientalis persicus]SEP19084.1 Outer membrane protein assembly factor BamB, contains PQQ-like beta-propeller repeat [Halorientalis persicus]
MTEESQSRRRFLRTALVGGAVAVAGCNDSSANADAPQFTAARRDRDQDATPEFTGWPAPNHDAAQTNAAPAEDSVTSKPAQMWEVPLPGTLGSKPIVSGGTIFCHTEQQSRGVQPESDIIAVKAGTGDGEQEWTRGFPGTVSPPTVAGSTLFLTTAIDGWTAVLAHDTKSGKEQWIQSLSGPKQIAQCQPTVANESVYVPVRATTETTRTTPRFASLDTADGSVEWLSGTEFWQEIPVKYHPPSVAHGRVYLAQRRSGAESKSTPDLLALDAATGDVEWEFTVSDGGFLHHAPVAGSSFLFLSSQTRLLALDPATGNTEWTVDHNGQFHRPAVAGNTVYVATKSGLLSALDSTTGDRQWAYTGDRFTSGPVVTNETAYLRNGSIINAINRSEPALQWEMSDIGGGRHGPSIVDGWLFAESPPATAPSLLAYTSLNEP